MITIRDGYAAGLNDALRDLLKWVDEMRPKAAP
jgi:hypothetical protein